MSKILVAYFSAEGKTAGIAKEFANKISADTFEIIPEEIYTKADLSWMNPLARCNKETFGKKDVPVKSKVANFSDYDVIFLGFPIWYGGAPNVVNTFCKDYNWTG
ncbi:MAG: NAD(P)H-dependent oxidoreductase, partial [Synergistaceae bacterium]|nr:NAD(P)H-dependent oxidoreductase [Synergistaceae bacterium]